MAAAPVTSAVRRPSRRRVRLSENMVEIPYEAVVVYEYKMDREALKRAHESSLRRQANRDNGEEAHRRSALVSAWMLRLEVENYMSKPCTSEAPDLPDMYLDGEPDEGDIAHGVHTPEPACLTPRTEAAETISQVRSDPDDTRQEKDHPKSRPYVARIVGALKSLRFPKCMRGVRLPQFSVRTSVRRVHKDQQHDNTCEEGVSCDKREVRINKRGVDVLGTKQTRRRPSRDRSSQSPSFDSLVPPGDTSTLARWHEQRAQPSQRKQSLVVAVR
eukprot:TRINITY_DN24378_c0_g1_i1.p1 TRINITY_DN24378_c0_g1~~TRINITY_DN24378_c0_g1_i1.p1  ORF type:complete len:273 (+),score=26.65 TRINITY_DN24378_c0_g1_i1:57-875(+)